MTLLLYLSKLAQTRLVLPTSANASLRIRTARDRCSKARPARIGLSAHLRQFRLPQTLRRQRNTFPQTDPFPRPKEYREGIASLSLDCFAATIDSPPFKGV